MHGKKVNMELWLDTANVDYVSSVAQLGILEGVTTNPSIVARAQIEPWQLIKSLLEVQSGWVAVQVLSNSADDMIKEAKNYSTFSPRILVKIPATKEGLRAIHTLSNENVPTLATALFSVPQALLSFKAGALYLAPYIGRIEDSTGQSQQILAQMQGLKQHYQFPGKIMGAGIRDISVLMHCLQLGLSAATVPHAIFDQFIEDHPQTLAALKQFAQESANFESKTIDTTCSNVIAHSN